MGSFKNGLKHGKGKWRKQAINPTNTYEGSYVDDQKEGYGVYQWASGNIYEGNYFNDERDGHGKMIWKDGTNESIYIGNWVKGI